MASKSTTKRIAVLLWLWWVLVAVVDAQMRVLNEGCSQYNVTDFTDFTANLDATLTDVGVQLQAGRRFATASQVRGSDPVYAMAQCRGYLSTEDCSACFAAAETRIRNCSAANGARVIFDGCFLRYESNGFFDQTTLPGNVGLCGKQAVSPNAATAFTSAVEEMLSELLTATPKIAGFYAAAVNRTAAAFGVAQCAETVSKDGCAECLGVAYTNLKSCLPDSNGRAIDAGCFLRYSNASFFAADQATDLAPFLKTGGSNKKAIIIGGVVGGIGGLLLLLLVAGFYIWSKRSSRKSQTTLGDDILGATELQGPVTYSYKDLKSSTNNFSLDNKLGEGGFGDVFKGTLRNGKIVAVKRLAIGKSQRVKEEFDSEVKLISNVHHRNLVRLLGCCSKGPQLLLVYQFMPNTSLDRFLFGERRLGSLNWKQRHDIITGTAKGLNYLHEEFHVCIIHRDIKTSNILLDQDFHPRIADFGLARLLPEDQTHLSTRFAGTLGYTAPEYSIHGQLSEKADVYSFGVVVLEIVSGQKCNEFRKGDPSGEYLLERAWKLYERNCHVELVDEMLVPEEYEAETVKKMVEIGLMCVQPSPAMRPTMSEVVVKLKSKAGVSSANNLTRPVFVDANNLIMSRDTSTSLASSSNANLSLSRVSGR